jgi:elongation factor P
MMIIHEGELCRVLKVDHVTPGKGKAHVAATVRNVKTGNSMPCRWNSDDKIERAFLEEHEMQYLYDQGESLVFMDLESYEQHEIQKDMIGDSIGFLAEEAVCIGLVSKGNILEVELPRTIEAVIVQTDPGMKGDTASGGTKPATLETGAIVQVPLFIQQGEKIKVDTVEKKYLERVKE